MLRLLLDEHVAPRLAAQLRGRRDGLVAVSMQDWNQGRYLGVDDGTILAEARLEGMSLVTYDLRTVVPLLRAWGEQGLSHAGVILVDDATVPPQRLGSLVRLLTQMWDEHGGEDWTDRVVFLVR